MVDTIVAHLFTTGAKLGIRFFFIIILLGFCKLL